MTHTGLPAHVAASQEHWRAGRRYLNEHRYELSRWAAENLHGDQLQIGPSGLITRREWTPAAPIPLENVTLTWRDYTPAPELDGTEPETADVRPLRGDGQRCSTYAHALGDLARPGLFEDRPCYRLLDVAIDGDSAELTFGTGTYFDVMNVCEAAAHELADATCDTESGTPTLKDLPFRSLIGDPCDLIRRPILPAVSALTIRRTSSDASFVLHWRDSTKVAHGGGLYQVMPVGMFQPSAAGAWNEANDFDLWRCMAREYSEEFLGAPEHQGHDGPLDYEAWPFYRAFTEARDAGKVTAHWLGLGVDPLTLVTDLLIAVVFDEDTFDALLGQAVTINDEGHLVAENGANEAVAGIRLTADRITELISSDPMQAAGGALLELASTQVRTLLARPAGA